MSNQSQTGRSAAIPFIALVLSLIALALSAIALFQPVPEPKETGEYDRIVAEVWALVETSYDDFGLQKPNQVPTTLTEALRPLFELARPIESDDNP